MTNPADQSPNLGDTPNNGNAKKKSFLRRRWLKVPVWIWLWAGAAIIYVVSQPSSSDSPRESNVGIEDESADAPSTTEVKFRFKKSDDPIENLLYLAEQANPGLPGWQLLGKVRTDDDFIFDDIRIQLDDDLDYQSPETASALIDVALAVVSLAKSPIQIDMEIKVKHSETQPDGSIEFDKITREWIEVTGDADGSAITVDVYGFQPSEDTKLIAIESSLQAKYPDVIVKITDTSTFDN